MKVRTRSYLAILAGLVIGVWAYQIDSCAFLSEPCSSIAGLLAILSFALVVVFGLLPLIGRWQWNAMRFQENPFCLQKWQERYDGPFGEVFEWLIGLDREGNLKS